ncbi:MAG: hypothetical protein ABJA78_11660 [Ferruginibacter sp.]
MKYLSIIGIACLLNSCSDSFINHTLKAEKIGDCSQQKAPINMNSNINGERYEFDYCIEDPFDGKNYKIERKGDSLIVSFPEAVAAGKKALYKLTLDVDAKPAYHHIILGDKDLTIVPAER